MEEGIKENLEKANQGHLLQFYSSLSDQEKKGTFFLSCRHQHVLILNRDRTLGESFSNQL